MIKLKGITRVVTRMYDNFWWLGRVLSLSEESNNVKISFLHSYGPSASHIYPAMSYSVVSSISNSRRSSNTATGHTHTLTNEETKVTAEK